MSTFTATPAQVSTAWHEASHVTVAWAMHGDAVIAGPTTIRPDALRKGYAGVELPEHPVDDVVTMLQAGLLGQLMAAERGLCPAVVLREPGAPMPLVEELEWRTVTLARMAAASEGPEYDSERIERLLEAVTGSPAEALAYHGRLLSRTQALLLDHWPLVTALAHALIERETLQAQEVLDTIHAATTPVPSGAPASGGYY